MRVSDTGKIVAGAAAVLLLVAGGCGRREAAAPRPAVSAPAAEPAKRAAVYPPVEPIPPGAPGGLPDDRTPIAEGPFAPESAQGAANVLQSYFALVESGRFAEAWRLWADGGRASGMSAAAFAASFGDYDSYHAQIGAPGRIEGAAGSLYVEAPVQVYARRKDGQEVHRIGTATLRRVNDVPGATPDQLRWRIQDLKLEPGAAPERPR